MNKHVDFSRLEREWGIHLIAQDYLPEDFRHDFGLAMDAQPTLVTTASSGIPSFLTNYVDPGVIRVLQAPNKGAEILGEQKMGDWTTQTAFFSVVENTGEVASYSDFNGNARADANVNWPQRQAYLFQTNIEYGDLEVDRAGLAKLNWVGEKQTSAAKALMKFADASYHFGISGLQNYGLLNDPQLSAAITPSTKAAGGTKWVSTTGAVVATANEVYGDIQNLFSQLVTQTYGLVEMTDAMTLALSPAAQVGLTATNSFGITVKDLLKESFPNIKIKTSPRYLTQAGNVVQLIADSFDGNSTGYCAFNVKQQDGRLIPQTTSYSQKKFSGTWGAIIKYPMAIAQMLGV